MKTQKIKKFSVKLLIFLMMLLFGRILSANPLLNANCEEDILYDNFLASPASQEFNTTITPFSYYKIVPFLENYQRVRLNLKASEDPEYYIKPVNSVTAKYFYSGDDNAFIEGQSGLNLYGGSNIILFEDASISFGKSFAAYCQFKQHFNDEKNSSDLFRTYGKFLFYNFSIEGGIDNVNLGPGEYGLLLSDNSAPYPLVKIQTEDYIKFFGKWDFILLHGWLNEGRDDISDPRLIAMRAAWKPVNFLELGCTRTVLYGGETRESVDLSDYHRLIAGKNENTEGNNLGSDILTGYDISLYLPVNNLIKTVRITKLYFEEAWSNLDAPWQDGDDESNSIKLKEKAFQTGILISTPNSIFRIEYTATSATFYNSYLYNVEGYSYKGLSLGHPYGRNARSFYIKYRYFFTGYFSTEFEGGTYSRPCFQIKNGLTEGDQLSDYFSLSETDNTAQKNYLSLLADFRIWNFIIEGYFRIEKTDKYDENPLPTQYSVINEDKTFYIMGLSASFRL